MNLATAGRGLLPEGLKDRQCKPLSVVAPHTVCTAAVNVGMRRDRLSCPVCEF